MSRPALLGRITAAYGRHYEVSLADGTLIQCFPRGKKSVFACGDEVEIEGGFDGTRGVITRLVPRSSLLWRSDAFRQKLISANLSHVFIVVATEPGFSPLLISRCLVACEEQNLPATIVLNKCDVTDGLAAARAQLAVFGGLGYEIIECSAYGGAPELAQRLAGERSIFVGQSGMGKSSLINALIPGAAAATREISTVLDSGKHTTTLARLYPCADAGWLIDSPGLQAFGLAHIDADRLPGYFREFAPHLGECRFRDCQHDQEPGCALRAALESGEISALRFDHWQQIRAEIAYAETQARGW